MNVILFILSVIAASVLLVLIVVIVLAVRIGRSTARSMHNIQHAQKNFAEASALLQGVSTALGIIATLKRATKRRK